MTLLRKTGDTYDVVVRDPDDGIDVTITLRKLNARDEAILRDSMRMEFADEEEVRAELKLGTWQLLTVQRAVVGWNHPTDPPPTPDLINELHPDVFDTIYAAIEAEGAPRPPGEGDPTQPPTTSEISSRPPAESGEETTPEEETPPPPPHEPPPAPTD